MSISIRWVAFEFGQILITFADLLAFCGTTMTFTMEV